VQVKNHGVTHQFAANVGRLAKTKRNHVQTCQTSGAYRAETAAWQTLVIPSSQRLAKETYSDPFVVADVVADQRAEVSTTARQHAQAAPQQARLADLHSAKIVNNSKATPKPAKTARNRARTTGCAVVCRTKIQWWHNYSPTARPYQPSHRGSST
jgi:hypothetical protein